MTKLAPICLFVYNRLEETKQTIRALKENYLASESDLFIFSDGPKNEDSVEKVQSVRRYIENVDGFRSINIYKSNLNKGLATSIIDGVSEIINKYGKVIVLEDDLITSANFLNFMNQALIFYELDEKVFSISGFTLNLNSLQKHKQNFYWGYRASSWGWATWKDRWINIDWNVNDYEEFIRNRKFKNEFKKNRGSDMVAMLKAQNEGRIDSWAIRWCYNQFKSNSLTLFPKFSKVYNIGTDTNATHTKQKGRISQELDSGEQKIFVFDNEFKINKQIISDFVNKHSIRTRLYWKIRSILKY